MKKAQGVRDAACAAPQRVVQEAFRGNKAGLPEKPCACCGRPMSWRKKWAKNWAEVKYCSTACQRRRHLP